MLKLRLRRIDALDERLNTTVTVMAESAREAADAATKTQQPGASTGLLHGLPIGLKDIFDTAGVLTAGGSKTQDIARSESRCDVCDEAKRGRCDHRG